MLTRICPSKSQSSLIGARLPWDRIGAAKLDEIYPGFSTWLKQTVVPGFVSGSRRLFVHNRDGQFGFVIAKRTFDERKLCTVYVETGSRGKGIASCLISQAIDWLGSDEPLITISEDRLVEFRSIISRFDFSLVHVAHSYYRNGIREFVFNGKLSRASEFSPLTHEQIRRDHGLQVRCMDIQLKPPGLSLRSARNVDAHRLLA
jgi:hypothetical protein